MSFVLDGERPPGRRAAKLLLHELDAALAALAAGAVSDASVHELRRCGKRSRALLRLVGDGLPGHAHLVTCWRRVGRTAAGLRDAAAMEATLFGLQRDAPRLATVEDTGIAEQLRAFRVRARHTLQQRVGGLVATLTVARTRVAAWRPDFGWEVALEGLVDGYRRSRQAARTAWRHPDPEWRHAWRKRCKSHALHLHLLAPLWPEMMTAWGGQWDELARRLGDEHDLHVLLTFLAALPRCAAGLVGVAERRALAERRENDALGQRLHAEGTASLERRVRIYARLAGMR